MLDTKLDSIDRKLLNLVQAEFPLSREPYADLGKRLDSSGDEVIHRIGRLKSAGFIRQISPVLDARKLGYQTTLVAMRVAENRLEEIGRLIGEHPGISHGYERDHYFNFWITLAIPPTAEMETELNRLRQSPGVETVFPLPMIKGFKLRVFFDMVGDSQRGTDISLASNPPPQMVKLSAVDKQVINELQQDLPLVPEPFDDMAGHTGMDVAGFLSQCQSLRERGIMRRFGAAVNNRKAGFTANAMTCWVAPPDRVETIGQKLASLPEVSHCYERKTNPLWRHNVFAMIHAHSREACQEIAAKMSCETGLTDYVLLFSTREFKKTRNKYLV
ncbi:MAG: Lrp/AsnC family transcriptional regulator [Chloroflexi bacterium]|nr:Lrp/AsnC family transcriptional regulator [Chloroflexota bacterium]